MPPEIKALLSELEALDTLGDHIWQLSLILEMNSHPECGSMSAANQLLLPAHLRSIWLTVNDQNEIAEWLCLLLMTRSSLDRPSLISVLSDCLPEVSFRRLIQSIHDLSDRLDEQSASQAIFALYDLLCHDPEDQLILTNFDFVRQSGILDFFRRWDTRWVRNRTNCFQDVVDRYTRALLRRE